MLNFFPHKFGNDFWTLFMLVLAFSWFLRFYALLLVHGTNLYWQFQGTEWRNPRQVKGKLERTSAGIKEKAYSSRYVLCKFVQHIWSFVFIQLVLYSSFEKQHLRWEYVATVTLWGLWRSRCKLTFQDVHEPTASVIKARWNDLVHTLKGEWSSIQGTSKRCRKQQSMFRWTCDIIHVYECSQGGLVWNYRTPTFLFPPPITWPTIWWMLGSKLKLIC